MGGEVDDEPWEQTRDVSPREPTGETDGRPTIRSDPAHVDRAGPISLRRPQELQRHRLTLSLIHRVEMRDEASGSPNEPVRSLYAFLKVRVGIDRAADEHVRISSMVRPRKKRSKHGERGTESHPHKIAVLDLSRHRHDHGIAPGVRLWTVGAHSSVGAVGRRERSRSRSPSFA